MSSFKRNIKNKIFYPNCIYCGSKSNINTIKKCTICGLWQPDANPETVSYFCKSSKSNYQRIFVINLKRDKNRWTNFVYKLKPKFCIKTKKIFRFEAVDGSKEENLDDKLNYLYDKNEKRNDKINIFKNKYPGSIGCYLSHTTLWKALLNEFNVENENYILIMEDDSYFLPFAIQNIDIIIEKSKKFSWDILYIGHNTLVGKKIHYLFTKPQKPLHKVVSYNTGFYGYVVKKSSLQKIIDIAKRFNMEFIDVLIRENFGTGNNYIEALFVNIPVIKHNITCVSSRRTNDIYPKIKGNLKR
jgi:GR25 family glycosyltransferase involved in LPS biosynthesis